MHLELISATDVGCTSLAGMEPQAEISTGSTFSDSTTDDLFYSTEKKRKEYQVLQSRIQTKRVRRTSKCLDAVVEQVTPEVSPNLPHLRTFGPFFPGQFEDGTARLVQVGEEELVDALSLLLEATCINNERFQCVPKKVNGKPPYHSDKYPEGSSSIFFSLNKPSIVLKNYLMRFVRYLNVSRSVFVVGLIYLDRIRREDDLLTLTELNIHRLLTTALCTAAKYLEDESHRNSSLSRIGGVPTNGEMNMLESEFLRRLKWDCSVSAHTYELYENRVFEAATTEFGNLIILTDAPRGILDDEIAG